MPNHTVNRRATMIVRPTAAAGGWTPGSLPNLKLWVKSDTGIILVGGKVSMWLDQSGNNNHLSQSDPNYRPIVETNQLNGYPVVKFDGSDDRLVSDSFILAQPTTAFIVFKQTTWLSGRTVFDGFDINTGRLFQSATEPHFTQYAGSFGDFGLYDMSGLSLDVYALATSIFNNGTSQVSKFQVNNGVTRTGTCGDNNMNGFTLAAAGGGSQVGDISVAEVALMASEATSDERALMQAYVTARYGIVM